MNQRVLFIIWIVVIPVIFGNGIICSCEGNTRDTTQYRNSLGNTLIADQNSFYSNNRLFQLSIGLGGSALFANTRLDRDIQDWYQESIRYSTTDNISNTAKLFGEGKYLIPISFATSCIHVFDGDSPIGKWGVYTTRAYLVGAPIMLLMQRCIGGSRPGETSHDAKWRPLTDENGVSGHAFMGAVPFLTIGKMNNNTILQLLAYSASTATAWSRINDNKHYFSQAAFGWLLAYHSVDAIFDTENKDNGIALLPYETRNGTGIMVVLSW